jgi:hypothetical protein|tara:strand:+ start:3908 stop:4273 length:366 start_codon:yes stop_codon:yes gene_type:complete
MDIDATFLPISKTLISGEFKTAIVYHQHTDNSQTYDPATGTITVAETDHNVFGGILSRERVEEGGVSERFELRLYVDHNALPFLPKTSDAVTYGGTRWRVVTVKTWSGDGPICSLLTCRSD